jgi:hypothetical protein
LWPFIPRVIEKFLDLANLQRHNDNYNDIKSAMEDIAGAGRTNQTIKGNSDTTAAHLADHANPHVVTAAQVGAYTKTELQTSGQSSVHWNNLTNKPNFADARWGAPVATKAALDAIVATQDGEVRLVLQDETVYEWDIEIAGANKWKAIGAIGDGLTSHSALNNLTNDDHPQYLRTDGTRVLTGDQDFAQHQAKNFVGDKSAVIPANPVEGQEWYDTINHRKMLYKGSLQGWTDISGKGAVIKDQEFTALAGQTVFDITVGQYEISTNSITVYKKDISTGKFELVPESEYTETNSTRFTLTSPATAGEVFYVKFFENTPEVINQSVKRDGTLQTNLNSDMLGGKHAADFANVTHASSHVTGGADVIPNATPAGNSGLMSGTDKALIDAWPEYMARQAIINGNMDIAQRGTSFTNPGGSAYTIDRFKRIGGGFPTAPANIIHSKQTLTSGDIVGAYNFYRISPDGAGAVTTVNDAYAINQSIENGNRNLCGNGKKVTASFWARSSIANKKIGVRMYQSYGTGGSPSAIEILNGSKFTLTSTWTKYSVTFTTNTLVGKTFGANGDDYLALDFGFLWGTSIGVQYGDTVAETFVGAGNIDIAQVQVNAGDTALPFQPRDTEEEQRKCLRFNRRISDSGNAYTTFGVGQCISSTVAQIFIPHGTRMRISGPTLTTGGALSLTGPSGTTIPVTGISIINNGRNMDGLLLQVIVASGLTAGNTTILSANNDTTACLNFDAEL